MTDKFFLFSRTIIGVLIMIVVQLAPVLGWDFSQDDANFISEQFDAILTSVGALLAAWGLRDAQGTLRLKP